MNSRVLTSRRVRFGGYRADWICSSSRKNRFASSDVLITTPGASRFPSSNNVGHPKAATAVQRVTHEVEERSLVYSYKHIQRLSKPIWQAFFGPPFQVQAHGAENPRDALKP